MSIPLDVIARMLREAITRPKERFERTKRRTATLVFAPVVPLFFFGVVVVGAVAVLSTGSATTTAIDVFRLALSAASSMFYSVCGLAAIVFGLTIAGNFAYTRRAERALEAVRRLEADESRRRTYQVVRRELLRIMQRNSTAEISGLLGYAVRVYPDMIASDEELTGKLISGGHSKLLSADGPGAQRLIAEGPRP
jgi:hypothetical protein